MLPRPIRMTRSVKLLGAMALLAAFAMVAVPVHMLGQSAVFTAPGRAEGAGPPLSIGVAATGIVSDIAVQEGSRVQTGQLLLQLACSAQEADVRTRQAQLAAANATYDKFRNGPRPDEIAVGEAVVNFSLARAEEADKTLQRTLSLQEGVTVTAAHVLEVKRDARIAAAQLTEARAQLSLLRAGSREEDVRQAKALRDAAAAELDASRARTRAMLGARAGLGRGARRSDQSRSVFQLGGATAALAYRSGRSGARARRSRVARFCACLPAAARDDRGRCAAECCYPGASRLDQPDGQPRHHGRGSQRRKRRWQCGRQRCRGGGPKGR